MMIRERERERESERERERDVTCDSDLITRLIDMDVLVLFDPA
jgi:hypothetical protein